MRVAELLTEDQGTKNEYSLRLVQRVGIRRLGTGVYAHVFQHPTFSNVTVKIFTEANGSYKRYIEWCKGQQKNPYVPKILSIENYKAPNGKKYSFVFMERMTPLTKGEFRRWLNREFSEDAVKAADDDNFDALRTAMDRVIRRTKDAHLQTIWAHIMGYPKAQFDLHVGSIMKLNGHIVFADPIGKNPD